MDEDQSTLEPPRPDRGASPRVAPVRHVAPQRLGDFELIREIGRGGMGIVYAAHQVSLRREVALKILPPGLGLDAQAITRFEREARAAARLHHTNIVPVFAIGEAAGYHYYAMELVEGRPLSGVLHEMRARASHPAAAALQPDSGGGPRPSEPAVAASGSGLSDPSTSGRAWFDLVARLIAEVADGLHYAHGQGIVHRDVKPGNLMLSRDGRLCLTDFGLARVAQEPGMTMSGAFLGTPDYMSPEQVAAGRAALDHRTDIYSLGAVLYELLTLRRPFEGRTRQEVMSAILAKEPRRPRRANARTPLDLETICLKAMEKDPDRRYLTAAALAEDLRQYVGRGLIAARRDSPPRRAFKWTRRHPVAATVALAATLVAASLGAAVSYRRAQQIAASRAAVSEAALDLREGRYREGLAAVESALQLAPDTDALRILRAKLLMKLARKQDAVEQAQQLLQKDAGDWRAHLILAAAGGSRISGQHDPSLDPHVHLQAVAARAPESADVYFLRALMADTVSEQIDLLSKALEIDPSDVEALLERINRYHFVKHFPAALADSDRLMGLSPRSAQGRRMRAWTYYYQRDVEGALAEIDKAIELDAEDSLNYEMRATLHDDASRFDKALADLDRAVELAPRSARLRQERSALHLRLGQTESAIADARRAIELDPGDRKSHAGLFEAFWRAHKKDDLRLAVARLRAAVEEWVDTLEQSRALRDTAFYAYLVGDREAAYADVERAITLAPAGDQGYRLRASLRRRDGDEAGVRQDCERAAACSIDLPGDLLLRGQWLSDFCHQSDLALADLDRAIARAPSWAIPFRWKGVIHQREGRYAEALADLDKALQLAPTWLEIHYNRGRVHAAMEQFEAAIEDFEVYLRSGSDGGNLRWEMAKALLRLGRTDEALAAMDAAERLRPKDEIYLRRRGFIYLWDGRPEEALAAFARAVEMDPSSAPAVQTRGYGAAYAGRPCEVVSADLDKALAMDPKDEWVAREIAWVHADVFATECPGSFRADLALELARGAVALEPTTPEFHETLGLVLYRRGAWDAARSELIRALELYPQPSPSALFTVAMACWRLGDKAEARSFFDRAASRHRATYPKDPRLLRQASEASALLGRRGS